MKHFSENMHILCEKGDELVRLLTQNSGQEKELLEHAVYEVRYLLQQGLITEQMARNAALLLGVQLGERMNREAGTDWTVGEGRMPFIRDGEGACFSPIEQLYGILISGEVQEQKGVF